MHELCKDLIFVWGVKSREENKYIVRDLFIKLQAASVYVIKGETIIQLSIIAFSSSSIELKLFNK